MRDSRLDKLAKVLVHYSLGVKKGDLTLLAGEIASLPLIEALYEELIKAGSHVKTNIIPSRFEEIFFKFASDEQLNFTSPYALNEISTCDKRIRIMAPENTRALSRVDSKKQTMLSKANHPIMAKSMQRAAEGSLNWVLTLFPTFGGAQEANMSLTEYEEFVFSAGYLNLDDPLAKLKEVERGQDLMVEYMLGKKEVRFKTNEGTDLLVNVEGMRWINCCGKRNFPDGEIFTGPNLAAKDGGVNGIVKYSFPGLWQNTLVEGIELVFEKGKVVSAKAKKNESFLNAMIRQDEGASRLGEIAIGTNYQIKEFTTNILFDEKIGGTFHAALGMGYPETGNSNQSALHWDMVCDLREGGTIEVDGELISKDGKFLNKTWPKP